MDVARQPVPEGWTDPGKAFMEQPPQPPCVSEGISGMVGIRSTHKASEEKLVFDLEDNYNWSSFTN